MQLDWQTQEPPTFAIGATTKYESDVFSAFLHGAYVHHPTLPGSFYTSASFNLPQRSPIKIEDIKLAEMYPPLLHFYSTFNFKPQTVVVPHQNSFELIESAIVLDYTGQVKFQRGDSTYDISKNMKLQAQDIVHLVNAKATIQLQQDGLTVLYVNPNMEHRFRNLTKEDTIGRIFLENRTDKPLQVKVFIEVQDIGKESPATEFVPLLPKAKASVPLRQIVFKNSILEQTEMVMSNQAKVRAVSFNPLTIEVQRENKSAQSFTTYSRNDIVWDDVRKIGAFINPQDETIKDFSNIILEHYDEEIKNTSINQNLYKAMLILNALRVYGIRGDLQVKMVLPHFV